MHLKSLTVKGFKSFASATTFNFEPGITCVIGPNGSGKSNVVDAISWVLGEQGAKALRGGKMEDVIFAGTAGRAALGRAEVTLVIDNGDGVLPIDYTEVSITRRMFRSGESDYEINGSSCRLLDIQELLSDSGIGRERHIIVGQGQLDSVLHARPEDRRAFIEEAAGILKHRKRKEKALRKLASMQENVTRISDLLTELRRQLKPLGRQAEAARKAAIIQADLRDSRLRLLADDVVTLRSDLQRELDTEIIVKARQRVIEKELAQLRERDTALTIEREQVAGDLTAAQNTWYELSALQERFRSLSQLAHERARLLAVVPESSRYSQDPDELYEQAATIREQEVELADYLAHEQQRLQTATQSRQHAEHALAEAEKHVLAALKKAADYRESVARIKGKITASSDKISSYDDDIQQLEQSLDRAQQQHEDAGEQLSDIDSHHDSDEKRRALVAELEQATADHQQTVELLAQVRQQRQDYERQSFAEQARAEALEAHIARPDTVPLLIKANSNGEISGIIGELAPTLSIEPGYETAVAAALGSLTHALAVTSAQAAVEAVAWLYANDAGSVEMIVGSGFSQTVKTRPNLPENCRWLMDVIGTSETISQALSALFAHTVVVPTLNEATQLLHTDPTWKLITLTGDIITSRTIAGGTHRPSSVLEVHSQIAQARDSYGELSQQIATTTTRIDELTTDVAQQKTAMEAARTALRDFDVYHSAEKEKYRRYTQAVNDAAQQLHRLRQSHESLIAARDRENVQIVALQQEHDDMTVQPVEPESSDVDRDVLAAQADSCRQNEIEIRLAVTAATERVRSLSGQADSLENAARAELENQMRAEKLQQQRQYGVQIASAVDKAAREIQTRIATSITQADQGRTVAGQKQANVDSSLLEVKAAVRELSTELEQLTSVIHRDDVARAQQQIRIEQLLTTAAADFGIDADSLADTYGPRVAVPASEAEIAAAENNGEPAPLPLPYHRPTQEKRAARAEKELAALGKVNPLALEEYAALEERHAFLSTQWDDLKSTRRDLLTVVKEIDDRIHTVFADAYADTEREFAAVFATLFPGGQGRLVLTDPDDIGTTGIEVEARPPGKKVKRLSLLSGGERSLTAVALLVAIFRARPSPFYIMDEVEAALDDTNLSRLLTLIKQLRDSSQLIVITHQQRTMEIADALYGVSMRGDGITQVISQRLPKEGL